METIVREMTEFAKTVPESRIFSESQLTNLVYDVVKKGGTQHMEKISTEITRLYYNMY